MESLPNTEIRTAIFKNNIPKWKLAEALGIADTSLSRKLRYELPAEEKEIILNIISELAEGQANNEEYKNYQKQKRAKTLATNNIYNKKSYKKIIRELERVSEEIDKLTQKLKEIENIN